MQKGNPILGLLFFILQITFGILIRIKVIFYNGGK
jgi:hypothetical protein